MPQLPFKWPPVTQIVAAMCIVGFMALVLYPVLHPSGEPLRRTSCLSNLKQLGLAYAQYEQDDGDIYPPGINTAGNGWSGQLYPYIKSQYVYHCPDDAHDSPFISYAENQNLVRLPVKKLQSRPQQSKPTSSPRSTATRPHPKPSAPPGQVPRRTARGTIPRHSA